MNLHTLSKLGFILTFGVFLVLFAATIIIGVAGTSLFFYLLHYYPSLLLLLVTFHTFHVHMHPFTH